MTNAGAEPSATRAFWPQTASLAAYRLSYAHHSPGHDSVKNCSAEHDSVQNCSVSRALLAHGLRGAVTGGEQLAGGGNRDVGRDGGAQQRAQHEQLVQRLRPVSEPDPGTAMLTGAGDMTSRIFVAMVHLLR